MGPWPQEWPSKAPARGSSIRSRDTCKHVFTAQLCTCPKSGRKTVQNPNQTFLPCSWQRPAHSAAAFTHPATGNFFPFTKGSRFDRQFLVPVPRLLMHSGRWQPPHSMCSCFFLLGFYLKAHVFLKESTSPVLGAAWPFHQHIPSPWQWRLAES